MNIRLIISVFFLTGFLYSCTRSEPVRVSGTDTIDNTIFLGTTYFTYGFLFSEAKSVSTYPAPGPDISIVVITDNEPYILSLQTVSLNPSFYKVGDYQNETDAIAAFKNLLTVDVPQWEDWAAPLQENQVWIYRTRADNYAKIRIISTLNEMRQNIAYGECTFEWVYQPDGSLTFSEE